MGSSSYRRVPDHCSTQPGHPQSPFRMARQQTELFQSTQQPRAPAQQHPGGPKHPSTQLTMSLTAEALRRPAPHSSESPGQVSSSCVAGPPTQSQQALSWRRLTGLVRSPLYTPARCAVLLHTSRLGPDHARAVRRGPARGLHQGQPAQIMTDEEVPRYPGGFRSPLRSSGVASSPLATDGVLTEPVGLSQPRPFGRRGKGNNRLPANENQFGCPPSCVQHLSRSTGRCI
ncbi:hypothetical protein NDU88_001682 [Pleurodeles waltl]|uniref:Uncharacterized protein n=1 Tax=Pleurodeles waltl TaxID=8319 RepID=A0AAV7SCV5_PLEWA|nr:hypothetical protein NDU88_001682 [Pleurodeles waltl]